MDYVCKKCGQEYDEYNLPEVTDYYEVWGREVSSTRCCMTCDCGGDIITAEEYDEMMEKELEEMEEELKKYKYTIRFVESESIYNEDTEEYEDKIIRDETYIEDSEEEDIEIFVKDYFLAEPHQLGIVRGDWKRLLERPTQKDLAEDVVVYFDYSGEIDWVLEVKREVK